MGGPIDDPSFLKIENTLGYAFYDRDLLRLALTHSSFADPNNEPLACLGDRVHNVWVARMVYAAMPTASRGLLTSKINALCCGKAQADVFFGLELNKHLLVGGSIIGSGNYIRASMASTAFEALVAAVELDGGIAQAEALLARVMTERLERTLEARSE